MSCVKFFKPIQPLHTNSSKDHVLREDRAMASSKPIDLLQISQFPFWKTMAKIHKVDLGRLSEASVLLSA